MKVSDICKVVEDCEKLRTILLKDERGLTWKETQQICDLLWNYMSELLNKEVE